jgi:hypothetical protein
MKTEKGEISKSMGIDTKPAHSFKIKDYWILVDPTMPEHEVKTLKNHIEEIEYLRKTKRDMRMLLLSFISEFEAENDKREMDGYKRIPEPNWVLRAKEITNETRQF